MIVRSPYSQMPITLINKAVRQKYMRQLHCMECGWPIADITDKVVMAMDGNTQIGDLPINSIGIVEIHCPRHTCKQFYRMEFAL